MFIGTSPEFELALYTLCFLAGQEENIIQVSDYEVKIKVFQIKSKYGDKVGSAYPEVRHGSGAVNIIQFHTLHGSNYDGNHQACLTVTVLSVGSC